tara:strand:- start:129 stop:392 length:264 start_codon:yes stop_codon:yes gene_type:complete
MKVKLNLGMIVMFGKFIIFAILAVSLYALFIRLKMRLYGSPIKEKTQLEKNSKKRFFGNDIGLNKTHVIISFLAALYLIWAVITLYR